MDTFSEWDASGSLPMGNLPILGKMTLSHYRYFMFQSQWHCGLECSLLASNGFKAAGKAQKANSTANTEVPPLLVQLASITPYRLLLRGLRYV